MTTKKNYLILTLLLLATGIINSCQNQFVSAPVNHQNSLLWEIKKQGEPTSYIYGTMHMINKNYYAFTDNMKSITHSVDAIVMELGSMPNPIQAMLLITNKKGTLQDIFNEEEWQVLIDFYKKEFDMDETKFISTYNNFKPFFLFQSMTQAYFEKDAESYDLNIMQMARENDTELIGLETIQEQLGFFDQIPNSEMAKMILESLNTYDKDKADFKKLQELYSKEKIDELMPLMKEQSPEFLKYEDLFLTNRNIKWIPKLKQVLSTKSCFIAVGAAHLFGKNGLISLLTAEGYSVNPIKK
jgi:hypothetical protein